MKEKLPDYNAQNLYYLYWGEPDRLPGNWHSVDDLAHMYNTTSSVIENTLNEISWERRLRPIEFRKDIWNFLCREWGMTYGEDFVYLDYIGGRSPVLYRIIEYDIGINIDLALQEVETRENHLGNYIVLFVPLCRMDMLAKILTNFFKKYRVKKRQVTFDNSEE